MLHFKAKCTKFDFGWSSEFGETIALPIPIDLRGPTSKAGDGAGRGGK